MQKVVALSLVFFLILSCQSFQYGPARVGAIHELPLRASPADQEFETPDEPEKDKIGMWIFAGIAAAAGVGAAVIVPMAIGGKL